MKKQLRWSMLALALFGLSGCGLKGPLFMPPQEQPAASPTTPAAAGQAADAPASGTQQPQ